IRPESLVVPSLSCVIERCSNHSCQKGSRCPLTRMMYLIRLCSVRMTCFLCKKHTASRRGREEPKVHHRGPYSRESGREPEEHLVLLFRCSSEVRAEAHQSKES